MLKKGKSTIGGLIIVLAFISILAITPVARADTQDTQLAVDSALRYLRGVQRDDGRFGSLDKPNDTIYVVMVVASANQDPNAWTKNGNSPVDWLRSQMEDPSSTLSDDKTNTGKIAWLILALVASGHNPRDFAGQDWITKLNHTYDPATGKFGLAVVDGSNGWDNCNHMWALLALKATGGEIPTGAITWLKDNQRSDGSWSLDASDSFGDTNSTALAIQALVACGESSSSEAIQGALAFLHAQQNDDGGFPWIKPSPSDPSSGAWVIQGLRAVGEDLASPSWTTSSGKNPISNLLTFQNQATGAFQIVPWGGTEPVDDIVATYQAIPALTKYDNTFPIEFPSDPSPPTQPPSPDGKDSDSGTEDSDTKQNGEDKSKPSDQMHSGAARSEAASINSAASSQTSGSLPGTGGLESTQYYILGLIVAGVGGLLLVFYWRLKG